MLYTYNVIMKKSSLQIRLCTKAQCRLMEAGLCFFPPDNPSMNLFLAGEKGLLLMHILKK